MMGTDTIGTGLPWVEAIANSFPRVDFVDFHRRQLPELLVRNGGLVAQDLRGALSLAFRVGNRAFSWESVDGRVEVVDGDEAAPTVVELSEETFTEHLHELLTASGAERTGRARVTRGSLAGWQRWEPAIQSLCSGRPIYDDRVWQSLVDRDGAPLDLQCSFSVGDDEAEMRHFLDIVGYLHLKQVFAAEEIDRFRVEIEHARSLTAPGDPYSWWSINGDGDEVVTRINYLGRHSRMIQNLCFDDRLAHYARLAGAELRVCDDRLDGPMVFIKHSNVVQGNGDLGWHVDDGIGGHPVMCPLIQAGIQIDHASAENGQLLLLAGSHRYTKHWYAWGEEGTLPVVALETEPGDLTIHYGDAMHTTPPPTADGAGRRALYYKFAEPKTFNWIPTGCHYNDALFRPDAAGRLANRATPVEPHASAY
jgi:hypothetical protein